MANVFYSRDCEKTPDSVAVLHDTFLKLGRGDVLIVPDVTHLAARWPDLRMMLDALAGAGVKLAVRRSSRQADEPVETWAKRDLRRAATERAMIRGAYVIGRPKAADAMLARKLRADGIANEMIASVLGVSPRTVARYVAG